jgi:hypothetical protein
MIGESWMDDPERLWTWRVRNLLLSERKIFEDGIELERATDREFIVRNGGRVIYISPGGRRSLDKAVEQCVTFLVSRKDAEMAMSEKSIEALALLETVGGEGNLSEMGYERGLIASLVRYNLIEKRDGLHVLTEAGRERLREQGVKPFMAAMGDAGSVIVEAAKSAVYGEARLPTQNLKVRRSRGSQSPGLAEAETVDLRELIGGCTDCEDCINKRVLDMLMARLPDAREIYDLMVALDEKLAGLRR